MKTGSVLVLESLQESSDMFIVNHHVHDHSESLCIMVINCQPLENLRMVALFLEGLSERVSCEFHVERRLHQSLEGICKQQTSFYSRSKFL